MNKKSLASILLVGTLFSSNIAYSAANYATQSNQTSGYQTSTQLPPLRGSVTMVPAKTAFQAVTTTELSSASLTLGQSVTVALGSDFYYNNTLIAPAGSQVSGNVVDLRKGGHAGKNGQLKIRFTNIITPYGQMIPISAVIKTEDGSGLLYAATAKDTGVDYAKDLGIGAGAGAVLGTAMGAMAGGSVGRGAIYGTALGAGLGLGKSLWDKGQDVTIPANSRIELQTDQPITVSSSSKY